MDNCYRCLKGQHASNLIYVDRYFETKAFQEGAEYYHIPAMIEGEILKKCGYFSSFPHHLTIASYIDPEHYKNIASNGLIDPLYIRNSNLYFTPSACLHFYPMLEGQIIEHKVLTTRARVYRYEDNRFDGSCRLWDFTVREIVFIGSQEYVSSMLQKFKKLTMDFIRAIGLKAELTAAHDLFYPSKGNSVKKRLQLSNDLKEEVVVTIKGKDVAITSFNMHGQHFSKPFNFDNNGQTVSGCVGYGLERWVSALAEHNIQLNIEQTPDL